MILDFINSIGYETFKNNVVAFFDQIMIMYRICGACNFTGLQCTICNDDTAEFEILFANDKDLVKMSGLIDVLYSRVNIYGRLFQVCSSKKTDLCLVVNIKMVPGTA